ncbi:flagellar assembly protein FliH [Solibacillus sp. FSL R5-0449]|uniref:flagellar assembly protein FliH n=1 Tax=Solibacillus sp. FSL R5-0449 TaxID=2921639 RepID=UPI0030CAD087
MSKIIRSTNAQQPEESSVVEIKLQNFFEPIHFGKTEDERIEELSQQSSIDIEAERQQMLEQANYEIEQQKAHFEQYRTEQLEAIEALKQSWEEEKLVLQQEAYDVGFAQGYEDGIQKANATMQQSIHAANETMTNAQKNAASYIESQESILLDLALTAAERIIHTSLDRDDEIFVSIVRRGLKEAREMKEVKLYVSPKYHPIVTEQQEELAEMFPVNVPFMIFVNEDLLDTESYIETNHGRIVISIDEQLQELRRQLYELIESKE